MKHIALRARSVHSDKPYTTPGLGDRIHSVLVGWVYGCAHGTSVTLHLTADKWHGGQFENKPESWAEIVDLLPAKNVLLRKHSVSPDTEAEWLEYLRGKGYQAELYSYLDHPGKHETVAGFDIAPYLKSFPLLQARKQRVELPPKFVTVQWDSNSRSRSITPDSRAKILKSYRRQGYQPVVVGGEASGDLRWSLKHIAFAMSKATFHVGVDSAFFHLAQLYMPWHRIHLYSTTDRLSHHALRARDNGSPLNLYL